MLEGPLLVTMDQEGFLLQALSGDAQEQSHALLEILTRPSSTSGARDQAFGRNTPLLMKYKINI